MIGATSGIGAAMASRLVEEGSKVIAVGRRQDRLDEFVHKHGKDKTSAVRFDINDTEKMDGFVKESASPFPVTIWTPLLIGYASITTTYPDLDCVFLNAGTQTPNNLADPANFGLAGFHAGFATNFTCLVNLTMKFLPFLTAKKTATSLI